MGLKNSGHVCLFKMSSCCGLKRLRIVPNVKKTKSVPGVQPLHGHNYKDSRDPVGRDVAESITVNGCIIYSYPPFVSFSCAKEDVVSAQVETPSCLTASRRPLVHSTVELQD